MELARTFLGALWNTLGAMAPVLLLGFAIAGLLAVVVSRERVERNLGGRSFWAVIKASFFGVPLPLCSCSVIPVAASLKRQGAGRGAVMAFLLSTPQTGADSVLATYGMLGLVMAIFRPVAAFVTGLLGGFLVNLLPERADDDPPPPPAAPCCEAQSAARESPAPPAWRRALEHGFVQLPDDIGGALLIGILLAATVVTFMPDHIFERLAGGGFATMLLMMLVGIPLYVCATASIPIAAALVLKGISPGAALVFLITGPATNAATLAALTRMLGKGAVAVYLATVAVTALASGLLLNLLLPHGLPVAALEHAHAAMPTPWRSAAAVILLILLARPLILRLSLSRLPRPRTLS